MLWIVGLGNPGRRYAKTRHNIGFAVVDELAQRCNIKWRKEKRFRAEIGEGTLGNVKVIVHKPQTFMNLSGESIRSFFDFYKPELEHMVVVYDDLDTEVGSIRLRYKGSAGGHNGMRSIIQHLGTEQFKRLRIGISRPPAGAAVVDHVLSPFSKTEQALMEKVTAHSCNASEYISQHSFEQAMAKFNGQVTE